MMSTHGTVISQDLTSMLGVGLPMRTQIWSNWSTPEGQNWPNSTPNLKLSGGLVCHYKYFHNFSYFIKCPANPQLASLSNTSAA